MKTILCWLVDPRARELGVVSVSNFADLSYVDGTMKGIDSPSPTGKQS